MGNKEKTPRVFRSSDTATAWCQIGDHDVVAVVEIYTTNKYVCLDCLQDLASHLKGPDFEPSRNPGQSEDNPNEGCSPSGLYYVQDTRQVVGNCMLLWGTDHSGYTCDLTKAGRYTADECRTMRETDVPWPAEYIEKHTVRHIRADINATAGGKSHPVAARAFAETRGGLVLTVAPCTAGVHHLDPGHWPVQVLEGGQVHAVTNLLPPFPGDEQFSAQQAASAAVELLREAFDVPEIDHIILLVGDDHSELPF